MQAIVTKYLGATNWRDSRVKATAEAGSVTVSWDDALNARDNYDNAARALCERLGWAGELVRGGTSDGYVYTIDGGPDDRITSPVTREEERRRFEERVGNITAR